MSIPSRNPRNRIPRGEDRPSSPSHQPSRGQSPEPSPRLERRQSPEPSPRLERRQSQEPSRQSPRQSPRQPSKQSPEPSPRLTKKQSLRRQLPEPSRLPQRIIRKPDNVKKLTVGEFMSKETENKIVAVAYRLYELPRGTYEKFWHITQMSEDISLINYHEANVLEYLNNNKDGASVVSELTNNFTNAQFSKILAIRGCGFDFKQERKVYHSYGFTPNMSIDFIPNDGIFGTSVEGIQVEISNDDKMVLKPIYDGTLIHVYKHAGKVYTSTKRSINIENSRFGKSDSFQKIFHRFFGVSSNEELGNILFDVNKEYSDFVHVFLLNDPYLQNSTRYDVGVGSLKYLKTFRLQGTRWGPLNSATSKGSEDNNVEMESRWINTFTIYESPSIPPAPKTIEAKIYSTPVLPLDNANKVLRSGYYRINEDAFFTKYNSPMLNGKLDTRILPGESLLCEYGPPDARSIIRLTPSSNQWRIDMLDNKNVNLFYQYVRLTDYAYPSKIESDMPSKFRYSKLFPELIQKKLDEDQDIHMLKNITMCYNLAVPEYESKNSAKYYVSYSRYISLLIEYLIENYEDLSKLYQTKTLQEKKEFSNDEGKLNVQGRTIFTIFGEIEKTVPQDENPIDHISKILSRIPGKYVYTLFKLIDKNLEEEV